MKVLVTHINPHLDDIFAIWLYKKFHPEFMDAQIVFLSASGEGVTYDNNPVDSNPEVVHFGIGRGKFDEHKGDVGDCAGSLVWKDILVNNLAPENEAEVKALEELVDWNLQIDLGKAPTSEFSVFSIQSFIRPLDSNSKSSLKAQELGDQILDRVLEQLIKKQQSLKDWEERVEFETKFGKTVAIQSETIGRPFVKQQARDLFLMVDPKKNDVQFFTPSFDLDLEPIYQKVKEVDSEADWFLHQSHHMVICGSGAAPDSKRTKLSFEELISLLKSL